LRLDRPYPFHFNCASGNAAAGGDHRSVERCRETVFFQGFFEITGQLKEPAKVKMHAGVTWRLLVGLF
jgi:hypothetical protein